MQLGYTQTAYTMVCNGEENGVIEGNRACGTFVEVHIPDGTKYDGQ